MYERHGLYGRLGLSISLADGFFLLSVDQMNPSLYLILLLLGAIGLLLFIISPDGEDDDHS